MWYMNGSSNFEGYTGKQVTVINVATSMRFVVFARIRLATLATPGGELDGFNMKTVTPALMSYIDDAVTKIEVPRRFAHKTFKVFRDATNDAWA